MLCAAALAMAACGGGEPPAATGSTPTLSGTTTASTSSASTTAVSSTTVTATSTPSTSLSFTFTLPAERSTSAGVFTSDGRLVRTLWRGERLAAGTHTRSWDLRGDDGALAPVGAVTVRLVHHDLQYRWEGVIGNTSFSPGQLPHKSFQVPLSLAIDGTQVHMGAGYNEAQSALLGFSTLQPQRPAPRVTHADPFVGFGLVASDGEHLYAANTGGLDKGGFLVSFLLSTGQQANWPAGAALCLARLPDGKCYPDQDYGSVIARRSPGGALPTGLAVQRAGAALVVAWGADSKVQVYDKFSGRLLNEWAAPLSAVSSNQLAMSADGDLWVVADDRVLRYTDLTGTPRLVQSISGLERPLAVAGDPANGGLVWVAEGGLSQQLKQFDRGGVLLRRIGQAGGQQGRAAVAADTFSFSGARRELTALALDGEGRIWLVDSHHNRLLRLAQDGTLIDQVAWLPASYAATVDSSRPSRVFANFLEFQVDDTRSPQAAGAWRLARDWLAGLPTNLVDSTSANSGFGGFRAVHTLSNGRSYGQLEVSGARVIVELTAAGTVREVARLPAPPAGQTPVTLYDNGELGWAAVEGNRETVYRRALEGFDTDGNPRWALTPRVVASVPTAANAPWYRPGAWAGLAGPYFPVTAGGKVVMFDPSVFAGERFHLGAVDVGAGSWSWMSSPSGVMDGRGSFQTRDQDANLQYGGNLVAVSGRSVVYGYHGEFFTDSSNGRVGQANQFMHFLDNGLFLGQFGTPSTRAGSTPQAGQSGNNFSWSLVRSGTRTFLYHNDESTWGGVHRWELVGLDDLQELNATGEPGITLALR